MQTVDSDVGFKSRPLSAEQVVALFQEYTPRRQFIMKGGNPHRTRILKAQRSVRFQLEGPPPLSDREREAWEKDLNQEYQMNQLLRTNRAPRSTIHISILNLQHREQHEPSLPDDGLLLKLSRQAVADPKSLDTDSCAFQKMPFNDKDDISFLFNLYCCLLRHHGYRSGCSHNILINFLHDIQSIGYLLADGFVVTAYDLFVRLVQLDESVPISPGGTHYKAPVIGTHSGMLRALPWLVDGEKRFLETWFPYDMGFDDEYAESSYTDEPTPPVLEIDTSAHIVDRDILRPLQFGESVSTRFLDTGGGGLVEETNASVVASDEPFPSLYEEGTTRSVDIPATFFQRRKFKPQPSCGDLRPEDGLNDECQQSYTSSVMKIPANNSPSCNDSPASTSTSRDITVVNELCSLTSTPNPTNRADARLDPQQSKTHIETDTQSTAGDSTWTFQQEEDQPKLQDEIFDDYASWFHSTVDDAVTIMTTPSVEAP